MKQLMNTLPLGKLIPTKQWRKVYNLVYKLILDLNDRSHFQSNGSKLGILETERSRNISSGNAKSRDDMKFCLIQNIVCNGFVCLLCLLLNVLELCGGWKVGKGAQTEPILADRGARYGSV